MLAGERARISNHRERRSYGVQLSPQKQRAHELHHEEVRVGRLQPSFADQSGHQITNARRGSTAQVLEQIDAAFPRKANAIGHKDAEQLLLARCRKGFHGEHREARQRLANIGYGVLDHRRQTLDFGLMVRKMSASKSACLLGK